MPLNPTQRASGAQVLQLTRKVRRTPARASARRRNAPRHRAAISRARAISSAVVRLPPVDEGERVLGRDADSSAPVPALEAGVLDQPGRGGLDPAVRLGQAGRAPGSVAHSSCVRIGLVKNEPALTESGSAGSITMPLPRRSPSTAAAHLGQRRAAADRHVERAGELGVAQRAGEAGLAEPEGDRQHGPAVAVLEDAARGSRSRTRRRTSRSPRRSRGRRRAPRRPSRRRPARRRRRSGSASRRSSRGCRTGTRSPAGPRPRSAPRPRPTARPPATTSRSSSCSIPRVRTSSDRAGHALVGDHDVRSTGQYEIGAVAHRGDQLVLAVGLDQPARRPAQARAS